MVGGRVVGAVVGGVGGGIAGGIAGGDVAVAVIVGHDQHCRPEVVILRLNLGLYD